MADSEENLKKLVEKIATEQNYDKNGINIKAISSGGANYSTKLYLANISDPPKPELKMFAKVAILTEEFIAKNELLSKVYEVESMFYTELAVAFEKIYQKNNVPAEQRLVIPKLYGHDLTKYKEAFVFENLEAKGYGNFDRMKTCNWEYAANAVQQLARFHALGIAFRKENPEEFERICRDFIVVFDMMDNKEMVEMFMTQGLNGVCNTVCEDHAMRLRKYFANMEGLQQQLIRFGTDKTMLVHGDFRPSNMMHRRRNGKLEVILLDYQTLRMGNPVGELMYFIFSSTDEEFRRLHYQRLIDHYHSELTLALASLRVDVESVYPKKTYQQDLIDMLPLGLMFGMSMIALVTVAPEDAPKMEVDITSMVVEPNEIAKKRIIGLINDFVRWGVL